MQNHSIDHQNLHLVCKGILSYCVLTIGKTIQPILADYSLSIQIESYDMYQTVSCILLEYFDRSNLGNVNSNFRYWQHMNQFDIFRRFSYSNNWIFYLFHSWKCCFLRWLVSALSDLTDGFFTTSERSQIMSGFC